MTSAPLVLAWLVFGHLLADFVLQTEGVALGKFGDGMPAWRALGTHVAVVAVVNVPAVLVFGLRGLGFVIITALSHLLIDRAKIVLTMRADGTTGSTTDEPAEGPPLDRSWTAFPALLFVLDQLAHLGVLVVAWALLLQGAAPLAVWSDAVDRVAGSMDRNAFHAGVLATVVIADLAIVNVRAGALFVATLVRAPRSKGAQGTGGAASPARVGATIGVLERLIVSALVLTNASTAIGFVIAAKTLARFKQLDDREFAEYYLLGTLASTTVAILSSLLALQALPH
jgi:Protein of unknown function (DUF3307)